MPDGMEKKGGENNLSGKRRWNYKLQKSKKIKPLFPQGSRGEAAMGVGYIKAAGKGTCAGGGGKSVKNTFDKTKE